MGTDEAELHPWVEAIGWRRATFAPIFLLILSMPWIVVSEEGCQATRPGEKPIETRPTIERTGWEVRGEVMLAVLGGIAAASLVAVRLRRPESLAAMADLLPAGLCLLAVGNNRGLWPLSVVGPALLVSAAIRLGPPGRLRTLGRWLRLSALGLVVGTELIGDADWLDGLGLALVAVEGVLAFRARSAEGWRLVLAYQQLLAAVCLAVLVVILPALAALFAQTSRSLAGQNLGLTFAGLYALGALAEMFVLARVIRARRKAQ